MQLVASRLLSDKGESVAFTREVETSFNSGTGAQTVSDYTFSANGHPMGYTASEIDGSLIKQGDIKLLLEKTDNAPLIGDSAKLDAVNYRVMDVKKTKAQGKVITYTCRLRK